MSASPTEFAQQVLAAFRAAQLHTNEEIAKAGGPSTTTITKLRKAAEGGGMVRPRGDTMRRIDAAAGWRDGSAMVLWETGALPDAQLSRAIGTGGVPISPAYINEGSTRAEVGDDGVLRVIAETRAEAADGSGESSIRVIYTPAPGVEVTPVDLMSVASDAHREALRLSYREGTRPSIRRSATDPVSALSATTGPTQENHALAADDTEGKFEEQEADPNA